MVKKKNNQMLQIVSDKINQGTSSEIPLARPYVSLAFAQSLDGSISLHPSAPVRLSNTHSQNFTHNLRAIHKAILIGIGTLIADNPQLTVRLVPGEDPRPVVVDSHLRFPMQARLLQQNSIKPWIACTSEVNDEKGKMIQEKGGKILKLPALPNGWVNLSSLMQQLHERGIRSLMVEGGARIITSFLRERLADQIILTIVPMILGGFRGVRELENVISPFMTNLQNIHYELIQDNLLVRGDLNYQI
ncbi:MAG: RibD family protein [Calditrichia bacterium]|nr:RibD family protein [Calditrichia bacterium]MCK5452737.1 RibD family protein [Calditrichia bacterium]